ncbi:hypothetical protein Hanom_Chr10g00892021 [Helianthus anomalus]
MFDVVNDGPLFVSSGSGLSKSSSSLTVFSLMNLSRALSAANLAFSRLILISFHGFILARKPFPSGFLSDCGSLSILTESTCWV